MKGSIRTFLKPFQNLRLKSNVEKFEVFLLKIKSEVQSRRKLLQRISKKSYTR